MRKTLEKICDEMPDYISDFFRHRFDLPPSSNANPNVQPYYENSEHNDSQLTDISTQQLQGHNSHLSSQEPGKRHKKKRLFSRRSGQSQGKNPTKEAFDVCHYKDDDMSSNRYSEGGVS